MASKDIELDEENALGTEKQKLMAASQNFRFDEIGLLSLKLEGNQDKQAFQETCVRFVAAQAVRDGLCPAGDLRWLCVRELRPEDFLDEFGHPSGASDWRQPISTYYRNPNTWQNIFNGTEHSDRRVVLFNGIKNINHKRDPRLYCSGLRIRRGNGAVVIEILDLQKLETEDSVDSFNFMTPIIFKKYDKPYLDLQVKPFAFGQYDNLVIEGMIAEPLGQTQNG